MTKTLINKISHYLASQPIDKAWVFGSYARTQENRKSDIDILVNFSKDSKVTLFKYIHIVNDLEALTGKKIDLVEEGQLKPFARESVEHDKILIYERKTTR
jgi:predicted nucleotidyltransferase